MLFASSQLVFTGTIVHSTRVDLNYLGFLVARKMLQVVFKVVCVGHF